MEGLATLRDDAVVIDKAREYWNRIKICKFCNVRFTLMGEFAKRSCKFHPQQYVEVHFYIKESDDGTKVTCEPSNEKIKERSGMNAVNNQDERQKREFVRVKSKSVNLFYPCCGEIAVMHAGNTNRRSAPPARSSRMALSNWTYTCNSLESFTPNKEMATGPTLYKETEGCKGRDHTDTNLQPININNISALLPFIPEPGERVGFQNIGDSGDILRQDS